MELELPIGLFARNTMSDVCSESSQLAHSRDVRLDDIYDAVEGLRARASVDEAIAASAAELSRTGHFARVLISRIEGSVWVPRLWHSHALDPTSERLIESHLQALRIPLRSSMVETEVVRRRRSQLVGLPKDESRTHRPFIDAIQTPSYVVAPIVVGEEVIALLHTDHGARRHPVSESDHDIVRHFADMLGLAIESIALSERIASERDHIRAALATAETVLNGSTSRPVLFAVTTTTASTPQLKALEPRTHPWGLTDRESAVIAQMAEGLTNREIAERLFVSESTVKSHVKHIFKKQGVASRSESIAQVWRRARWLEVRAS